MISIPGTVYLSRARLLTALVVFFIGGLMAGELARVVAPPSGLPQPTLRVGTVVNIPEEPTSTHAWVQMVTGEDPIELPLSAGYIPVVGDEVNVLFLATAGSSQGLILSGRAGQAGNLVLNGHFQRSRRMGSSSNNPPYHWTVVTLSGQAPVFNTYLGSSSGLPIAQLYDSPSSGAADHLVYSAAIPVTPGEDITVAAATEAFVVTGTTTLSLYVGWFTRSDQTWEQAASTSLLWSDFDTFPFVPDLGGTVVVPEGAAYARVAIRNQSTAAGYISVIAGVEAHR